MTDTATKELGFSDKLESAVTFAEGVKALKVTNAAEHAIASEKIERVRELEKELEAEYKAHPIVVQAKKIQAAKGELATLLEDARKTAKKAQMAYEDAEEQKRRAEEARLAAIAKKEAEDAAIAAAAEAEKNGQKDEAQAIIETPVTVPTVVLPKTAPKTANRRTVKKFRIVNEALIPRQYLSPDSVKIGGVVRSLGAAANIPGVEVYEEAV